MLNDELEHLIPSFKDCINNLRKENKNYLQSIHNLENEVKEYRQKIESYSNIKDILDEKVDSIAVEKYKNMKPDMIANIVNQWKRNAQYYKQKELSDRNRYMELQEELKRYKQDNVKCKTSLDSLQQEVKILRNVVERQKTDKSSTDMNNYIGINSDDDLDLIESSSKTSSSELKRPNTSFVNVSPFLSIRTGNEIDLRV
ncbi:uncharacterized protein LOC103509692 [Diaphorina citri]|uniref:Uncharacterized protein LOC103509692 n=1 Tax=Diaphorina citri TaxID=121845 RepID=A0A1S4ECF9_DIACI|nr:uncharacterized protein LOC103509692 [Diaphorina citri]